MFLGNLLNIFLPWLVLPLLKLGILLKKKILIVVEVKLIHIKLLKIPGLARRSSHGETNSYLYGACSVTPACQLFEIPWTVAPQAPLSLECSKQEYWNILAISCSIITDTHNALGCFSKSSIRVTPAVVFTWCSASCRQRACLIHLCNLQELSSGLVSWNSGESRGPGGRLAIDLRLMLCRPQGRETRQFTSDSAAAFPRPPACGPIVFCSDPLPGSEAAFTKGHTP